MKGTGHCGAALLTGAAIALAAAAGYRLMIRDPIAAAALPSAAPG